MLLMNNNRFWVSPNWNQDALSLCLVLAKANLASSSRYANRQHTSVNVKHADVQMQPKPTTSDMIPATHGWALSLNNMPIQPRSDADKLAVSHLA